MSYKVLTLQGQHCPLPQTETTHKYHGRKVSICSSYSLFARLSPEWLSERHHSHTTFKLLPLCLRNRKRERGNWWFNRGDYSKAIQCYSAAVDFLDDAEAEYGVRGVYDCKAFLDQCGFLVFPSYIDWLIDRLIFIGLLLFSLSYFSPFLPVLFLPLSLDLLWGVKFLKCRGFNIFYFPLSFHTCAGHLFVSYRDFLLN